MSAPLEHKVDSQKLTADAHIHLYEIQLRTEPVTLRFSDTTTNTWQGNVYGMFSIHIAGERRTAEDEEARPTLQVINPEGLFNSLVRQRLLDRATVIRRTILLAHLEADVPIYQQRMWYVSRVADVTAGQSITMELRSMSEGPNMRLPARQFCPPEFPLVRLR